VKTYGIYLAYPPGLDLRTEGLGRLLGEFLKEATSRTDRKFVIACPSWTRKSLIQLSEGAGIPAETLEILGSEQKPKLLEFYDWYVAYRRRERGKSRIIPIFRRLRSVYLRSLASAERFLVTTRSALLLAILTLLAFPFVVVGLAAKAVLDFSAKLLLQTQRFWHPWYARYLTVIRRLTVTPQASSTAVRLFRFMEEAEAKLLVKQINSRRDISAWYAPAAFWPHFNQIKAPRLICVPDVVLAEFPVGFSLVGGDRFLNIFGLVEATIEGGNRFVTYSEHTKYSTLVDRYHVNPAAIDVLPHGANRLDDLIKITGFPDDDASTDAFCVTLLHSALYKAVGSLGATNFNSGDIQFLLYASQFRPNKNILSLLRAYEYLLKQRYVGHKLVLTGNPNLMPEIGQFIREHNLQNDVLCLHGLTARELAACYRLAELAVNPSLSEGGCPFTLTEALSVGTPVVMGRIAVTEEVITDPDLQDAMLFDPYDWKDMAARIEWALQNREALLTRQLKFYAKLSQRTWRHVVDEHIAILDRISEAAPVPEVRS
jgi:glycosyltransferase involved in cell wall biosynthesis